MLTQHSRYRRLVGLVTSVVGNGKRVRVQFAGLAGTSLLQASTLETVDVAQQEAQATKSPGGHEGAGGDRVDGGGGGAGLGRDGGSMTAVSRGLVRDSCWGAPGAAALGGGTLHRWLPARVMASFCRRVPCCHLRPRRPLRALGCAGATEEGGAGDAESSGDEPRTGGGDERGSEGGGLAARRSEGVVKGAGAGRAGSLPLGYSFKGPAPGSELNPCVQGDMEPWTQELYGFSGRRYKGGP